MNPNPAFLSRPKLGRGCLGQDSNSPIRSGLLNCGMFCQNVVDKKLQLMIEQFETKGISVGMSQ